MKVYEESDLQKYIDNAKSSDGVSFISLSKVTGDDDFLGIRKTLSPYDQGVFNFTSRDLEIDHVNEKIWQLILPYAIDNKLTVKIFIEESDYFILASIDLYSTFWISLQIYEDDYAIIIEDNKSSFFLNIFEQEDEVFSCKFLRVPEIKNMSTEKARFHLIEILSNFVDRNEIISFIDSLLEKKNKFSVHYIVMFLLYDMTVYDIFSSLSKGDKDTLDTVLYCYP